MRLLVVDDEDSLLLTLVANLEMDGFEVSGANDGEAALSLVQANEYDLVLSDIRMPGMNGVELFGKIKSLRPQLPMVLMTAFAMETQVQDAIANGVYTVISKPFDLAAAFALLRRAGERPKVLIVDGPAHDAPVIARGLAGAGLRAEGVRSIREGVAALESGPVDVCVVDQDPDPGTLEAAIRELKEREPTVAFIVLAGQVEPAVMTRVSSAGSVSFVQRPFDLRDLMRLIAKARAESVPRG